MATFTPRYNSDGMENNQYWYSANPFFNSGYGLPNCTCYAWGRWFEITGTQPVLSLHNADTWYKNTSDNHARGKTPKLGCIMCWSGSNGHVAVVEEIKEDGTVITSNSDYSGKYFYLRSFSKGSYNFGKKKFQGCIYLDDQPTPGPSPGPGPVPRTSVSKQQPIIVLLKNRGLI